MWTLLSLSVSLSHNTHTLTLSTILGRLLQKLCLCDFVSLVHQVIINIQYQQKN